MRNASPATIHLKDYRVPSFFIETVELHFDLQEEATLVTSTLTIRRNPAAETPNEDLVLDGIGLELQAISLDNRTLSTSEWKNDTTTLTVLNVPAEFQLKTRVRIYPDKNTELEGLYRSSGNYCTQCEAQGFRKITYFLDRPDVMASFTTTIEADKTRYPILLSNGNPIASGKTDNGRHWQTWQDPHKKPAYLFALVAGDLACDSSHYTTLSGRKVTLQIFTEHHNVDKTAHAMHSIKRAMKWEEQTYRLEYDLDIYMIVAVDDFNMGAMENKGLNVFNSKYVLARPDTATDTDYVNIEAVIGHEYFHNWTGNRVTCRDWFQLSLKEGLTVFRDQSFTADRQNAAVKRIHDVRGLRSHQFAEDASPMAHPVRPDEYIEINNFYTVTVYEKGAEVVRLYQTLLGKTGFQKGMDLYFQRHDGQAVTTDDFRNAMADANGVDLSQLQRWYDQAGTPVLTVRDDWDAQKGHYSLHFEQQSAPNMRHKNQAPFLIPVKLGLLDNAGNDLPLILNDHENALSGDTLQVTQQQQSFHFTQLKKRPVPSLLREFSAPVKLHFDYSDGDLAFLMANDNDAFNRWEAGQTLALRVLLNKIDANRYPCDAEAEQQLINAYRESLDQDNADPAWLAEVVILPDEKYLAECVDIIDVEAIHFARKQLRQQIATALQTQWEVIYQQMQTPGPYSNDAASIGKRRLKNTALAYLCLLESAQHDALSLAQFENANNMTDTMGALSPAVHNGSALAEKMLSAFEARWKDDSLVMDKWFSLQATAPLPQTLAQVKTLMSHPLFSLKNPNKVRALIGAFSQANPVCFHAVDSSGYDFLSQQIIELDRLNPQIASRLAKIFTQWRRFDPKHQEKMKTTLQTIHSSGQLSRNLFEIVDKSLQEEKNPAK